MVASIGIAHGATDDAMLERIGVRPPGGRRALSALYGALAIGTFFAARRTPRNAPRALFALAWLHFGAGDAAFARACGSRAHGSAAALVRGAIPLCIGGRDARSNAALGVALGTAALHLVRRAYADALDVALPAALLYVAPAGRERLGFAIYFGAWHAPRHLALVLARDPRSGGTLRRLQRFVAEAAPNALLALVAGAVAFARRDPRVDGEELFGAMILAITVPHQLAVWLLERDARSRS